MLYVFVFIIFLCIIIVLALASFILEELRDCNDMYHVSFSQLFLLYEFNKNVKKTFYL